MSVLTSRETAIKPVQQNFLTQGDGILPIVHDQTPDRNSVLCTLQATILGHEKTVTSTVTPSPEPVAMGEVRTAKIINLIKKGIPPATAEAIAFAIYGNPLQQGRFTHA